MRVFVGQMDWFHMNCFLALDVGKTSFMIVWWLVDIVRREIHI